MCKVEFQVGSTGISKYLNLNTRSQDVTKLTASSPETYIFLLQASEISRRNVALLLCGQPFSFLRSDLSMSYFCSAKFSWWRFPRLLWQVSQNMPTRHCKVYSVILPESREASTTTVKCKSERSLACERSGGFNLLICCPSVVLPKFWIWCMMQCMMRWLSWGPNVGRAPFLFPQQLPR